MSWDDPSDWETMDAIEPRAGDELERLMARYARVRLEPSPAQAKRARSAVMETAWRSRIDAEASSRRWRLPFSGWSGRRVATAASAAVFAGLLVGSSAFAASRAGGPLYDTRIAIEDAMLPSNPAARLQAQIANAQVRLAEAYDAEIRGDQGALTAALQAYAQDASALAATTGPSTDQVLMALQQHRDVLQSLIQRAPSAALPGLDQALSSSDKAIERLTAADGTLNGNGNASGSGSQGAGNGNANGNPSGAGNGNANGGSSGAGNGNANGAGNGNANGNANGNPNGATPTPTLSPDQTQGPTPKPGHTPKPAPSMPAGQPPTPAP